MLQLFNGLLAKSIRLAAAIAMAVSCLTPVAAPVAGKDIASGRQFAERNCARCHAIGRTGKSPLKEAPPFRIFATQWPLESLEEALAEGIVVGHTSMPEFKLTPRQIDDFLGFLDSIQTGNR